MAGRSGVASCLAGAAIFWLLASVSSPASGHTDRTEAFSLDDYFALRRFVHLRLSDDGRWLAFATERAAGRFSAAERETFVIATRGGVPQPIEIPDDASQLIWVPGAHSVAYLSKQGGTSQVYTYDVSRRLAKQMTHSEHGVLSFAFRPSHADLALVIARDAPATESPDQLKSATTGILLDSDISSAYDFVLGARAASGMKSARPCGCRARLGNCPESRSLAT